MKHEIYTKIEEREDVLNKVRDLLIRELKIDANRDDLDPDTPLFATGLGLDSVDAVVIIVEMESEFNIAISEEEGMQGLRTINTIVDLVLQKLKNDTQR